MQKTFLFTIVYLLLLSSSLIAQTGVVRGTVRGPNGPVPGVNAFVMETTTGAVSNADGVYEIRGLRAGEYEIRFSSIGYETQFFDVVVLAGKIVELNVTMEETVIRLDEVQVIGKDERDASDTKVSAIEVDPRSAKVLPGAVEDVLRTLQSLPGVLAPNDFSSQLVVRGSGPDQNLIIIDDVEIFNPYRLYGAVSMFNPDAVEDINLITGGFPAKYGDRLSAVLDVSNREGTTSKALRGSLNASIVSANLVLEGKNPFDIKGSWMLNGRRTYYDLILEPFAKGTGLVEDNVAFPNFYDVQMKLVFGPFAGHRFILSGIISADGVNVISGKERKTADSISVNNVSKNDVASFSWQYGSKKNFLNRFTVSWYRNGGNTGFDSEILDPSLNRKDFEDVLPDTLSPYLLGFRFNSDFRFQKYSVEDHITYLWNGGKNSFEAGAGIDFLETLLTFSFDLDPELRAIFSANPAFRASFSDLSDLKMFARQRGYVQNTFSFDDKFFITPGVRYDRYEILDKGYFAPRLAASYAIDPITTLRATWGLYYQSPGYEKLLDAGILYDLSDRYTRSLEAEKAIHYVVGLERWLTEEWNVRLEGYYKDFTNLIIPQVVQGTRYFTELIPGRDPLISSSWTRPVSMIGDSVTQIPVNGSYGEAYGFEVLLAKQNKSADAKLTGWISYSLAYAKRFEKNAIIPFRFDQRHTLNIVLDYQLDETWSFGMRWQYGSGFPYNEPLGVKPRIIMVDTDGDLVPETPQVATRTSFTNPNVKEVVYDLDFGNQRRFNAVKPDYHRLDLRVSAAVRFLGKPWVFYLDVINVYNRTNVVGYDYYITKDLKVGREVNGMLPILPTLGFSVRF